jgi:Xaa-Pro dipeptidase
MYTTTIGPPRNEWRELLNLAHTVAGTIVATARPGVAACDVARQAREAMRMVEGRVQFHYNFGYSVGASFPPHWLEESGFHIKENNTEPLEAGMVFHIPLTMRVLGRFAAGTSRTIEITDTGARVLTGQAEERG